MYRYLRTNRAKLEDTIKGPTTKCYRHPLLLSFEGCALFLCSPSALGLVCGVVYMAFIIVTQLVYAKDRPELVRRRAGMILMR